MSSNTSLRTSLSLLAGALALLAFACTAGNGATKPKSTRCTPGNYVFCRCQDRAEGTKLCNEDGETFGKCEPCETDSNPELPADEDPLPRPDVDAGPDSQPQGGGKCGDKIVQEGEDCDDGNKVNDDGCDDTCHLAGTNPLATRSCPGLDVHVWSQPVTLVSTTIGAPQTGQAVPTCTGQVGNSTTGAAAGDRVFRVTAHKTGTMKVVTSDTNYDSFLYVTESCTPGAQGELNQFACVNGANGTGGETLTFPVTAGKAYSVLVDGAGISNQVGTFRVTFSMQ
jgi:cysteine-rich repeat protein